MSMLNTYADRRPLDLVAEQTSKSSVDKMIGNGKWKPQVIPAEVVGLTRDMHVFRAKRSSELITYKYHGNKDTFCPPLWWDLAPSWGACGLGWRCCFLMLTHRSFQDPLQPVLYHNVEDYWRATERWLRHPTRRPKHTLGLGIDRSDSLLYEGVTGHARNLIPMFASAETNPCGNYLILLTKSKNTNYLEGLPTANVAVTFSLNPEPIADLWEGKWPDTLERITPSIKDRLLACKQAQDWGFETRWRIDPILYPPGWQGIYEDFFCQAASLRLRPHFITLGTYREKNSSLDVWRKKWGLPAMEWEPANLVKEGTHFHVPETERIKIYHTIEDMCRKYLPSSWVSLCKETHSVRKHNDLCNDKCNCLIGNRGPCQRKSDSNDRLLVNLKVITDSAHRTSPDGKTALLDV